MVNLSQLRNSIRGLGGHAVTRALTLAIAFALSGVATQAAQAQTFQVIHNFTGGADGATPSAGLTMDAGGNLYGTTYSGGVGFGTVFKLKQAGSGWVLNPFYSFAGGGDGANPEARVVFGPDGLLYGTTTNGGVLFGTVFKLGPSPTACISAVCPGTKTTLYTFTGIPDDGENPQYGDLIFDHAGNIYGTTVNGGVNDCGLVYELTPSGTQWKFGLLYSFGNGTLARRYDTCLWPDGAYPFNDVILDGSGNLYGTNLQYGANGYGTVFQLAYSAGSGWTESVLYSFDNTSGSYAYAGLIFDQSGNLYGATSHSASGGGTVFELTHSNGGWTYSLLYHFTGPPECGPHANLVMDAAGNLYGTTFCDGAHSAGSVFKLTNTGSGWTLADLYDFTGGNDGGNPISNVIFDANGSLYGTASSGGALGHGVVWKITP